MLKRMLVLVLVVLFVTAGNAVYLGDAGKTLSDGSVTLIKLNVDVDNKYTDTAEVQSIFDTKIGETSIEALSDVDAMTPVDGQVLTWDTDGWTAETPATGGDMYKATYDTVDDGTVNSARKLDADYVGVGLYYNVDSIELELNGTTLMVDEDGLKVNADGITNSELADNCVDTEQLADDSVGSAEVDWSTPGSAPAGNEIGAATIPIQDEGTYYDPDNVEAALQAIGLALSSALTIDKISHTVEIFTTDSADYVCNLTYEPVWVPDLFYGRSVIQEPDVDFTYNLVGKTVTLDGGESSVELGVSYYYVTP